MRGFKRSSAGVVCALFVAVLSGVAFSEDFDSLEVGEEVPGFTLKDLGDKEYTLEGLEGQVVVIQFGSSTTLAYIEQIKAMNGLAKKYRREKITFLTIYTNEQKFDWQADDYFSKYERAKGLRFQFSVQTGQRMGGKILVDEIEETVYKAYGSVPAGVFIVDQDGKLAFKAKVVKATEVETVVEKLT